MRDNSNVVHRGLWLFLRLMPRVHCCFWGYLQILLVKNFVPHNKKHKKYGMSVCATIIQFSRFYGDDLTFIATALVNSLNHYLTSNSRKLQMTVYDFWSDIEPSIVGFLIYELYSAGSN